MTPEASEAIKVTARNNAHMVQFIHVVEVKSVIKYDLRGRQGAKIASESPRQYPGIFKPSIYLLTRCAELESCSRSVLAVDDGSCTAAAVILLSLCYQIKM